jgi:hypothetical protein
VYYPLSATQPLLLSNPFPSNFPYPYPPSALAFQPNLRTPYVQQWNFNIERSLGGSRMIEIGYVGSKGTDLIGARDINQPPPSTNPYFERPCRSSPISTWRSPTAIPSTQPAGALRTALGFRIVAAGFLHFRQIHRQRFQLLFERPAIRTSRRIVTTCARSGGFPTSMSASGSWPATATICRSASASRWLKGWQTFGILQFQTGQPFTVALLADDDNSNTGIDSLGFGANDRPNVVGNPKLPIPAANEWFNTSAFAIPPYGSFGNSGRNTVEGPGMATVDLSLVKNTTIRERATVQFRVETFNVLNHTNFGLPDNFIGSPTFGQILSAGNPRRVAACNWG